MKILEISIEWHEGTNDPIEAVVSSREGETHYSVRRDSITKALLAVIHAEAEAGFVSRQATKPLEECSVP